jgi:hypothetical protein
VLALAQPSEAKIVYTPAHVAIGYGGVGSYHLDLNHDRINDFTIQATQHRIGCSYGPGTQYDILESGATGNGAAGASLPLALPPGSMIGSRYESFGGGRGVMAWHDWGNVFCKFRQGGHWIGVIRRYLGLKFYIRGKAHYGWARLNVTTGWPPHLTATLTGYAYETIPGKSTKLARPKDRRMNRPTRISVLP